MRVDNINTEQRREKPTTMVVDSHIVMNEDVRLAIKGSDLHTMIGEHLHK